MLGRLFSENETGEFEGEQARLGEREMLRDSGVQVSLSGRMRMLRSALEPGETSESKVK